MKNKKGFTLVELLAVIVILGVLLLIAVPSATTIINNSRKKSFESAANLVIDNVETVYSLETLDGTTTIQDCYIPLSDIESNLERGTLGALAHGYVSVTSTGTVKITFTDGRFSISNADKSALGTVDYTADAPDAPTPAPAGGVCSWY